MDENDLGAHSSFSGPLQRSSAAGKVLSAADRRSCPEKLKGASLFSFQQSNDGLKGQYNRGAVAGGAFAGRQSTHAGHAPPNWTVSRDSSSSASLTFRDRLADAWLRCRTYTRGVGQLIRTAPNVALVPLLVLVVLVVAGELGVWAAARRYRADMRREAAATVRGKAQQIEFVLQGLQAPVVAFAALIKQDPNIVELNRQLVPVMGPLLRQLDPGNYTLRFNLYPWAVRSGVYPPTPRNLATLNFNSMDSPLYTNLIRMGSALALDQVRRGRDLVLLNGPFRLSDFDSGLSVVSFLWLPDPSASNTTTPASASASASQPATPATGTRSCNGASVSASPSWTDPWGFTTSFTAPYAPNVTLGNLTDPVCRSCGAACAPATVNGTPYRYWGYCESIVLTSQIVGLLRQLQSEGEGVPYKYVLYRIHDAMTVNASTLAVLNKDGAFSASAAAGVRALGLVVFESGGGAGAGGDAESVLSPSSSSSGPPVCAEVASEVLGLVWALCIAPEAGWRPGWEVPLRAMVAVCSVLVAALDFAYMVSRERHRLLMKAMLPEKVIRRLTAGRTYAQPFSAVTILFSDIVSYTNLSSELTPHEVVDLLNMLYIEFDSLVDRHGLYKVETIGDAFMCVGGAPEPCHPRDAAIRTARMALDMLDCVTAFTAAASGRRIQIRVGMNTGDVVAAVMGKKMPHWCLVGDTVNVSSRMESSSRPMMVQVGAPTAELLHGCSEFHLEPRGAVDVKGKGRMFTYWLHRAASRDASVAKAPAVESVGEADLALGGAVTVTGDVRFSGGSRRSGGSGGGEPRRLLSAAAAITTSAAAAAVPGVVTVGLGSERGEGGLHERRSRRNSQQQHHDQQQLLLPQQGHQLQQQQHQRQPQKPGPEQQQLQLQALEREQQVSASQGVLPATKQHQLQLQRLSPPTQQGAGQQGPSPPAGTSGGGAAVVLLQVATAKPAEPEPALLVGGANDTETGGPPDGKPGGSGGG